jgi:O-antigen/teichoic acid export membrane protein
MTSPVPGLARSLPPVYAAAALRVAFPLLALPVMAARLGADEFGRLSLLLVWAGVLSMLVEGGFLAAATREAVRADAPGRWRLAQQVFSARCVLSAAAALAAVAVSLWLSPGSPLAALLLAVLACALGWPATWYLQASGQLHRWARVELVVYALWLAAVFALAHGVGSYLALNAVAALALAGAGWWWLRRDLRAGGKGGLWSASALGPGLRLGWTMLPVSLAGAAYSFALPAVASSQMARSELGLYYLADRVVRAVLSAGDPVVQLVYPRIVARFGQGARAAWGYAGRWALAGAAAGGAMWLAAALAWPGLQSLFGARAGAVDTAALGPVFLTLALLWPLLLGWRFLGYAMLGSGQYDRAYRACVVVGGVVGAAAAWRWAGQGATALALVALAVEGVVIASALAGIALTRRASASAA